MNDDPIETMKFRYPTHEEALRRVAELESSPTLRDFMHREVYALRRVKELEALVKKLEAR